MPGTPTLIELLKSRQRPDVPIVDHQDLGDAARHYLTLQSVGAFLDIPDPALVTLARGARVLKTRAREVMLRQGARAPGIFVIRRGSARVEVALGSDNYVTVASLSAGDVFGVASTLSGWGATASVTTLEDSEFLLLDRAELRVAVPGLTARHSPLLQLSAQRRLTVARVTGETSRRLTQEVASTIAVYSPTGGSGKTTVALNLAAALAQRESSRTVLVDLALPYNHAALMCGVTPPTCLARLGGEDQANFDEVLLSALSPHPSGFFVLASALRPEEADLVSPGLVEKALRTLEREVNYVVIDTGVGMTEQVLTVLEQAQETVVIALPQIASLSNTKEVLRILERVLRVGRSRIHVAVNHRTRRSLVSDSEIAAILEHPIAVDFGYGGLELEEMTLRAEVAAVSDPRSPLSVAARALATSITAGQHEHRAGDAAQPRERQASEPHWGTSSTRGHRRAFG